MQSLCDGSSLRQWRVRRPVFGALALALVGLIVVSCSPPSPPPVVPKASLTVGPGLRVFVAADVVMVSVALLGADGRVSGTYLGRVKEGSEVYSAGQVPSGGSARVRVGPAGMVGRGDPPTWFKDSGVSELESGPGVIEHIYKGAQQVISVRVGEKGLEIVEGEPPSAAQSKK